MSELKEHVKVLKVFPIPQNDLIPTQILEESKYPYSPPLSDDGTVLKGLMFEEVQHIFKKILSGQATDQDYYKKIEDYYIEISYDIPLSGRKIDMSFTTGQDGLKNYRNPKDYIIGSCMLSDNGVDTKSEGIDNRNFYRFYTVDIEAKKKKEENDTTQYNEAMIIFGKLLADKETNLPIFKNAVIELKDLLGITAYEVDKKSFLELSGTLSVFMQKNPTRFIEIFKDTTHLERRALIHKALDYGILKVIGTNIFYDEIPLGNTVDDAINVLSSDSKLLLDVKTLVKDKTRNSIFAQI
jgi:hypothetical protein